MSPLIEVSGPLLAIISIEFNCIETFEIDKKKLLSSLEFNLVFKVFVSIFRFWLKEMFQVIISPIWRFFRAT